MVHLSALADTAYDNAYHNKLRGVIWQTLRGSKFERLHNEEDPPGFAYSNPFPPHDMREGDERKIIVASHDEELLAVIADGLLERDRINVGEMSFGVDHLSSFETDVGEPGTTGTIDSGTGLLVRIPPWRCEDYDIDHPGGDTAVFWRPEHTTEPLIHQLESNLDRKHGLFAPEYLSGPSDVDGGLFESYELIKTFSVPVTVTEGETMTYVLSKWEFGYTVRDDDHRRHLNLALDCGLGERNGLGLGFMNIAERTRPGEQEENHAFA